MDAMDLLDALGSIRDKYVLAARESSQQRTVRRFPYSLAALLALVLICAVLLQTPMGAAAVEAVKEAVTSVIERLFPPKDVIVDLEGDPTAIPHEAQGQEPQTDVPGFAMYVDTSLYAMTEESGNTYVRPLLSNDSLPKCEMEIAHIPGQDAQSAARSHWETMAPNWDDTGEIHWADKLPAWVFSFRQDGGGDAPCEDHFFVDDGQGGAFHIVSRYFLEASEGHGTRFAAMIQSFQVVSPEGHIPTLETKEAQRKAYRDTLQTLYTTYCLPGGYELGYDGISDRDNNKFAVYDVDGDGSQELILKYGTTSTAGNTCAIYDYDEDTDSVKEELLAYIHVEFDESGYLIARASHAHGLGSGGILWPYTLYQYDSLTDTYDQVARVDTWEKQYYPHDYAGNPFPDDLDEDGDGVVYLLYFPDTEEPQILDGEAFRAWEMGYRTAEIPLPWVSLAPENIEALVME